MTTMWRRTVPHDPAAVLRHRVAQLDRAGTVQRATLRVAVTRKQPAPAELRAIMRHIRASGWRIDAASVRSADDTRWHPYPDGPHMHHGCAGEWSVEVWRQG